MSLFHHIVRFFHPALCIAAMAGCVTAAMLTGAYAQVDPYTENMQKQQESACILVGGCDNRPIQNNNARPYVPQVWTAIALSKTNLRNASVRHANSQAAAEKSALVLCGTVRPDCIIAISRANRCVSLAVSTNHAWGTGFALNWIESDHQALASCTAEGGTQCVVTAHPCQDDGPVGNKYSSLAP